MSIVVCCSARIKVSVVMTRMETASMSNEARRTGMKMVQVDGKHGKTKSHPR